MVERITDKIEIGRILALCITGKKLVFTKYYRIKAAWRGIPDEKVLTVFKQFDNIIAIEKKILKQGDTGYELFYALENGVTFSIATCPSGNKLFIIHAIEYHRNLSKRFTRSW